MDDQAKGLRELVRDFRQESTRRDFSPRKLVVSTGPPLVVLVAATPECQGPGLSGNLMRAAHDRGIQLVSTSSSADGANWLLADVGSGYNADHAKLWQRASVVLLVTAPDPDSVLAAYATLKAAQGAFPLPPVELVVCNARDDSQASLVYESLRSTCELFLPVHFAGCTRAGEGSAAALLDPLVSRLLTHLPVCQQQSTHLNPLATQPA